MVTLLYYSFFLFPKTDDALSLFQVVHAKYKKNSFNHIKDLKFAISFYVAWIEAEGLNTTREQRVY